MLDQNLFIEKEDPKVLDAMKAFEEKTYPVTDEDKKNLLESHQELKNKIIQEHIGHLPQEDSNFLYEHFLTDEERKQAGSLYLFSKYDVPGISERFEPIKESLRQYPHSFHPSQKVSVTGDLARGFNMMKIGHMGMFAEDITPEALESSVDAFINTQRENESTKSLQHRVAEMKLGEAEGFFETAGVLFEHPGLATSLLIESGTLWLPAFAYGIGGAWTGGVAGAIGGSALFGPLGGGLGGTVGAWFGGRAGAAFGLAQTHGPLWIFDYLDTKRINPMDREALINHFSIPSNREKLREQSRWYGFTLAGLNMLTGGFAGYIRRMGKPLLSAGIDVAGEGVAEIAARKQARGYLVKGDKKEAFLEMIISGPSAIGSTLLTTPRSLITKKIKEKPGSVAAEDEASEDTETAPVESVNEKSETKVVEVSELNPSDKLNFIDELSENKEFNEIVDISDDIQSDLEPETERNFSYEGKFQTLREKVRSFSEKVKDPKKLRQRLVKFYRDHYKDHLQLMKFFVMNRVMESSQYNSMSEEQQDIFLNKVWAGPEEVYYNGQKVNSIELIKSTKDDLDMDELQLYKTAINHEKMRRTLTFAEKAIPYLSLKLLKNKTPAEQAFAVFAEGAIYMDFSLEEALVNTQIYMAVMSGKIDPEKGLDFLFFRQQREGIINAGSGYLDIENMPGSGTYTRYNLIESDVDEKTDMIFDEKSAASSSRLDHRGEGDDLAGSRAFVFIHEFVHLMEKFLNENKHVDPSLKKKFKNLVKILELPSRSEILNFEEEQDIKETPFQPSPSRSVSEQFAELAVKHIIENLSNKDLKKLLDEGIKEFNRMRGFKKRKFSNYGFNYDLFKSKAIMFFFNDIFKKSFIDFEYKDILNMGFKDKETKKRFDSLRAPFKHLSTPELDETPSRIKSFFQRADKILNAIAREKATHEIPFAKETPKQKVSLSSLVALFPNERLNKGERNHSLVSEWTSDDEDAVDFREILSENGITNPYGLLINMMTTKSNHRVLTERIIDYAKRGIFLSMDYHINREPVRTERERKSLIKIRIMENIEDFNKLFGGATSRESYELTANRIYNILHEFSARALINWNYSNTGIMPELEDIIPKGVTIKNPEAVNKILKQVESIVIEETQKEVRDLMVWFSNFDLSIFSHENDLRHIKEIIHTVIGTKAGFNTNPYEPSHLEPSPSKAVRTIFEYTHIVRDTPLNNLYKFLEDFESQENFNYNKLNLNQLKTLKSIFEKYRSDYKEHFDESLSTPSLIEKEDFNTILNNKKTKKEFIDILLEGIHTGLGLELNNNRFNEWIKENESFRQTNAALQWVANYFKQIPSFIKIMDSTLPSPVWGALFGQLTKSFAQYRIELKKYLDADYNNQIEYGRNFKNIKNIIVESLGGFKFSSKIELLGFLMHIGTISNIKYLLTQPIDGNPQDTFMTRLVKHYRDNVAKSDEISNFALEENPFPLIELFLGELIDKGILTRTDFKYLQSKWDSFRAAYRDTRKARPDIKMGFIEPTPFKIRGIKVRGGYAPVLGAHEESMVKDIDFTKPIAGERFFGRTKHRSEYLGQPIMTDINLMTYYYFKQILGLAYYQKPLSNFAEVFRNERIQKVMNKIDPGFKSWSEKQLKSIYHDQVVTKTFRIAGKALEDWLKERSDPSIIKKQTLGLSKMNILVQNSGYISSMHYINTHYGVKGNFVFKKNFFRLFSRLFLGGYKLLWKNPIMNESLEMKTRYSNSDTLFDISRGNSPFNYKSPKLSLNALNLNKLLLKWYFETSHPLNKNASKTLHSISSFLSNNILIPQTGLQIIIDSVTYETIKELEIRKGRSLEQGIRGGERAVQETQSSTKTPLYMSEFEKSGLFESALFFTGWVTTNYNFFTTNRKVKILRFNRKRVESEYRAIRYNKSLSEEEKLRAIADMKLPWEIKGFLNSTKSNLEAATYVYIMGAFAAAIFSSLYDKDDEYEDEYGWLGAYAVRFMVSFLEAFPLFGFQAASFFRPGRFGMGRAYPGRPHFTPIEAGTTVLKKGVHPDNWTRYDEKQIWEAMGIMTGLPLKGLYDNFVEER